MSYKANQYNYATPLSSTTGLASSVHVPDRRYFMLSNNVLDGTCYPITGDIGLLGNTLSDDTGVLAEPFVVTIDTSMSLDAFIIISSAYNFPVDYIIDFYNGETLLHSAVVTNNTSSMPSVHLDAAIDVTSIVITISRISQPNSVACLYNAYVPAGMQSSTVARVSTTDATHSLIHVLRKYGSDTAKVSCSTPRSALVNNATTAIREVAPITVESRLNNVHSVMKQPSRRIYGRVYITYTDPMLSSETAVPEETAAYNSRIEQLFDGVSNAAENLFTLYDNDLTGAYVVGDSESQVGWVSNAVSGDDGYFDTPVSFVLTVAPRPVLDPTFVFGTGGSLIEDFTLNIISADGNSTERYITGNTSEIFTVSGNFSNVSTIIITISKVKNAGWPAVIIDVPIVSTILYVGYKDNSQLMSIDLLEELTYSDEVEALGGISANEVTVVLDNSDGLFNFNNPNSLIAPQMKRNRRIEPWLGAEINPGVIEWYKLGTYWSYKWSVPVGSLTASVVGFDTLGLLDTTDFINHQTQVDKSIGQLIAYVLDDARQTFPFIEYTIDPALYDIIIPYAWFEASSHTTALRKISECFPLHVYCDRNGVINAVVQQLRMESYTDIWADSTNVISKEYDSLYTTLPNVINVTVSNVKSIASTKLVEEDVEFEVEDFPTKILNFGSPYVSNLSVNVDCDSSISYTYTAYSWGIIFYFTGTGMVRSIICHGNAVDTVSTATVTHRDSDSVKLNGIVTRDISSDFIQNTKHASMLINRIVSLSEHDRYDATVEYRGDIAVSINDQILLLDGIAPDNRYKVKRHQLYWNGALSGSAYLNT